MFFAVFCVTALVMVSFFSCSNQAPKASLKTDVDSLSYAYGVQLSEGLDYYLQQQRGMTLTDTVKDDFIKGFLEGSKITKNDKKAIAYVEGKAAGRQVASDFFANINDNVFYSDPSMSLNKSQLLAGFIAAVQNKNLLLKKEETQMFVQTKTGAIQTVLNEKLKTKNQDFLDSNKSQKGVTVLPSGLQFKVVSEGSGVKPTAKEDTVKVNYKGSDITGNVFESNDSITFPLDRVIPGWTEGIQLMPVGSKYTFYIPYNLAYGERGQMPKIKPYSTLIFDVELLDVSHAVPAPPIKK